MGQKTAFLKLETIVASYMILYNTPTISREDLNLFSEFLTFHLTDKNQKIIDLYSHEYYKEFLDEFADVFKGENGNISIKEDANIKQVNKRILGFTPADFLFKIFENEETTKQKFEEFKNIKTKPVKSNEIKTEEIQASVKE